MIAYKKIERALTSLRDSTDREIVLAGETVTFAGLNSSYVSHQSCRVSLGHQLPELIIIRNPRYALAIMPEYSDHIKFEGQHLTAVLPASFLHPLFLFPAAIPQWLKDNVNVVVPDSFVGFDDDGKPRFANHSKLIAIGPHRRGHDPNWPFTVLETREEETNDPPKNL